MPENTANRAPTAANAPMVVANSSALGATGYMPYHHVPSPTPSGKAAIAACCASMFATTLPSVTMPGVECLTQSAPMPTAIDPIAAGTACFTLTRARRDFFGARRAAALR